MNALKPNAKQLEYLLLFFSFGGCFLPTKQAGRDYVSGLGVPLGIKGIRDHLPQIVAVYLTAPVQAGISVTQCSLSYSAISTLANYSPF